MDGALKLEDIDVLINLQHVSIGLLVFVWFVSFCLLNRCFYFYFLI